MSVRKIQVLLPNISCTCYIVAPTGELERYCMQWISSLWKKPLIRVTQWGGALSWLHQDSSWWKMISFCDNSRVKITSIFSPDHFTMTISLKTKYGLVIVHDIVPLFFSSVLMFQSPLITHAFLWRRERKCTLLVT